jgi:type I restriction enzyme S subunit
LHVLFKNHEESFTMTLESPHHALDMFIDQFSILMNVPNGVQKVEELILQLAVSGRLNTQDPSDEPASDLLKRINAEKQALIKAGKLKAQKPLPPVDEAEAPFEIPPSWVWTRLGEVGTWGAGSTPNRSNPSYYNGEITWFKSGELKTDVVYGSEEKITELALKECSLRLNQPNDVMIAMYGATIGKVSIAGAVCTTNQAVCACTPFSCITSHFLLLKLKALYPTFVNMGAGGAQPNISKEKIVNTPFPLPPLDEQKRIVAKVDELMALCDALGAQLNEQQSHATALLNSLVHELIGAGAST